MKYFIDTSALVKLFSNEAGSDKVREIILNPDSEVYFLELLMIELWSAIYRKFRNHEIPEENLKPLNIAINRQLDDFIMIPMNSGVLLEAKLIIYKYGKDVGLRTLDALHVAGWAMFAEDDWIFVSSDINQIRAVELMHYNFLKV